MFNVYGLPVEPPTPLQNSGSSTDNDSSVVYIQIKCDTEGLAKKLFS